VLPLFALSVTIAFSLLTSPGLMQTAQPPASPWDGSYRLDYNSSQLAGDSFTYTKSADGMWHLISDDGTFDFKPDGQSYTLHDPDRTQTATMHGPRAFTVKSQSGKMKQTIHVLLSADGRALSAVTTKVSPDHPPVTVTTEMSRNGAGDGFFAKWTSTKLAVSGGTPALLTIGTTSAGVVTWSYSPDAASLSGLPDGTPLPVVGPGIPPGDTISFQTVSPRRMEFVTAHDGKTMTVGYYQLSEDGRQLDDTYWDPKDPAIRQTKVYRRQQAKPGLQPPLPHE
jgi:hypothetical protein